MLYAEIDRNKMFRGTVTDKAEPLLYEHLLCNE